MAVASASAAATSATADDEKPDIAVFNAALVPMSSPGLSGSGLNPSSREISPRMSTELTG